MRQGLKVRRSRRDVCIGGSLRTLNGLALALEGCGDFLWCTHRCGEIGDLFCDPSRQVVVCRRFKLSFQKIRKALSGNLLDGFIINAPCDAIEKGWGLSRAREGYWLGGGEASGSTRLGRTRTADRGQKQGGPSDASMRCSQSRSPSLGLSLGRRRGRLLVWLARPKGQDQLNQIFISEDQFLIRNSGSRNGVVKFESIGVVRVQEHCRQTLVPLIETRHQAATHL